MSDHHNANVAPEITDAQALALRAAPALQDAGDLDADEYRAFVEATSGAVFRVSPDWTKIRRLYGSSELSEGYEETEDWIARLIPAADITRVRDTIRQALATKTSVELEHAVRRPDDSDGWIQLRAMPILDGAGEVVEWLGTITDLDGIRALQYRQDALLAELQHRVRNNLAVVRSIVRRTAANSADLDEFSMHLDGRLASFARTQAAVSRDPLGGLDLKSVLLDELAALLIRDGERAYVTGPDVILTSKTAETLALAFHELATNAVKFGAWAVERGVVRVSWAIETESNGHRWVGLVWKEDRAGVPIIPAVDRGFGIEFLDQTLPYDLDAKTEIDVLPDGFVCKIYFRINSLT